MADIASPLNALYDGPVAKTPQIGRPNGMNLEDALASTPATFETTDTTTRMYVVDQAGRVVLELPDPRFPGLMAAVAANASGLATASGSGLFETTDTAGTVLILDAAGRVVATLPDPVIASLLANASTGTIFETTDANIAAIILDSGGRVSALIPSQAAVSSGTPTTVAEVVAARGSLPSLAARLAVMSSAAGSPLVNSYGKDFMRQSRNLLSQLDPDLGEGTGVLYILTGAGDSYTQNRDRFSGRVAKKLKAKYGDGGAGWTSFAFLQSGNTAPWTIGNQPSFANGNVSSAYAVRYYGNVIGSYFTTAMPDLGLATLTQSGDAIEVDFPAAHPTVKSTLYFRAVPGAVLRYSTDGGATWTVLSLDSSTGTLLSGVYRTIAHTYPASAGTLRLEWVAGTVEIGGIYPLGSKGAVYNKTAATGSQILQWSNAPAEFDIVHGSLASNAVAYMDGPNSQSAGLTDIIWGNRVTTFFGRLLVANPSVDRLLMMPPENMKGFSGAPMSALAVKGLDIAVSLRCSYRNHQDSFGSPTNTAEYRSNGTFSAMNQDDLHPGTAPIAQSKIIGGIQLAAGTLDMIIPF